MLENLFETEKCIKHYKDIIVARADKGNKTVIIEKQMYINEANEILRDRSKNTYDTRTRQKYDLSLNRKGYYYKKSYVLFERSH